MSDSTPTSSLNDDANTTTRTSRINSASSPTTSVNLNANTNNSSAVSPASSVVQLHSALINELITRQTTTATIDPAISTFFPDVPDGSSLPTTEHITAPTAASSVSPSVALLHSAVIGELITRRITTSPTDPAVPSLSPRIPRRNRQNLHRPLTPLFLPNNTTCIARQTPVIRSVTATVIGSSPTNTQDFGELLRLRRLQLHPVDNTSSTNAPSLILDGTATVMESNDEDDFECSICYNEFDDEIRKPKRLPCNHTVCLLCLMDLRQDGDKFTCPFCRHAFDQRNVDHLPDDITHLRRPSPSASVHHTPKQPETNTVTLNTPTNESDEARSLEVSWCLTCQTRENMDCASSDHSCIPMEIDSIENLEELLTFTRNETFLA